MCETRRQTRARQKKNFEQGLCRCGRPRMPGLSQYTSQPHLTCGWQCETRQQANRRQTRARQDKYFEQGLCRCGKPRMPGLSKTTSKPYLTCGRHQGNSIIPKKQKTVDPAEPFEPPTDDRYRVIETNVVGLLVECGCDDPIILAFADGIRDVFWLRDVEKVDIPPTDSHRTQKPEVRNSKRFGRPRGITPEIIDKMLAICKYLKTQPHAIDRSQMEQHLGYTTVRCIMNQPSRPNRVTLESLGIVERVVGHRRLAKWRITEYGKTEGDRIVETLRGEL